MHVLMVHGALGSASQLEPLCNAFAPTYDVSIVELEGHGTSPGLSNRYEMERFAQQIRARVTEQTVVLGYSMGGYAALLLASSIPSKLAGVITLGTKLAWTPEIASKEVGRLDASTIRAKVPKFAEQLEQRHRGAGGWESVLAKTAALMTDLGASPLLDDGRLAKIDLPVRLMVGDRDNLVSIEETAAAARKLPRGQLAVLPGTPHPIEQVRPELIVSMVDDFLR